MNEIFRGQAFHLHKDGDVGILTFDLANEKVNKLSEQSLGELELILKQVPTHSGIKALLIRSAKKGSFIVGADINVIQKLKDETEAAFASTFGQKIFNLLEDLKIPTLAAVEGPCMGGGTELILSCRYRVASDHEKTVIGLPEVKLGLLPGWGGTYRLPKLVGLMAGTDMILTGKGIRADKALKMGLVDAVIPSAIFTEKSLEFAQGLARGEKIPGKKFRQVPLAEKILTENFIGRKIFFKKAQEQVDKSTGGHYPSPYKSLDLLENYANAARDTFLKQEAKRFGELWATSVSKNLVNLFLMTETAKRDNGTDLPDAQVKGLAPLLSCGVLGAGVMGGGIAAQAATFKVSSVIKDLQPAALSKALAHARGLFKKELKKKRIKPLELENRMNRIRTTLDYSGFKGLDLVIEAVVENVDIKKSVFKELEKEVRPTTVIATNTSSLRLEAMQDAFSDPSRFVGLHFFNPVDKMPLIEVIVQSKTSPEVVAQAVAFAKAIGKTPVVVKDGPGFLVNRLLMPWLNEAAYCLNEGHDMAKMDKALKKFGMPMGPFELLDEVGLDVSCKVGHILSKDFGARATPSPVLDKILEHNKKIPQGSSALLGRKSGEGFYRFDKAGGRKQELNSEKIKNIVFGGRHPSEPNFNANAMVERMLYPMVNEAARALGDGIVKEAWQVDLGMIFGTGFPPFRGGLCRWADSVGLAKIVAALDELAKIHGERMKPSEALIKFASQGSFYK